MQIRMKAVALAAAAALLVAGAATAAEELSDDRIEALVELLRERGVLGDDDAKRIVDKNDAYESKRSWLSRISLFGDMRGRVEQFRFQERHDRTRLRYRLRLGAEAEINDYVSVVALLASGGLSNSSNQTLGSGGGSDFGEDSLFIDKAFLKVNPFGKADIPIPTVDEFTILFGKMSNPFNSKIGSDLILWDGDHTPEGIATTIGFAPCDCFDANLDAAYYVLTENSGGKEEDMFAFQLDTTTRLGKGITDNFSASFYQLNSLGVGGGPTSGDFEDRNIYRATNSAFYGNTDGLHDRGKIQLLDLREAITIAAIENLPVTLYGRWIKNFSAHAASGNPLTKGRKKDTAWSAGIELGDKKKNLKLGAGYFYVEADAVPSSLTDSDLFDGHTNAKGWAFSAARQVWTNTDLVFTTFLGDAIDPDIAAAEGSFSRFDRVRMQGDIVVKF